MLAAHRAGLKTVILPKKNLKDLVDVPKRARSEMNIIPVEHIDQVLGVALAPAPVDDRPARPRRKKPPQGLPRYLPESLPGNQSLTATG